MKKLNNLGKNHKKIKNKVMTLIALFFLFINYSIAYAATEEENSIKTSAFGKGLTDLFNDLSAFLLVLSPIVGGLLGIYFFIRKNAADEQDQKQWNKRLIITGICVVGAVLVSGTLNVITGYFTTSA